jgi:hypothetical protein
LTEAAQNQSRAEQCLFEATGNEQKYFDGPSYFDSCKMLAEFKNPRTRIQELDETYDEDDQFFDFGECLETIQDKEFARYINV